MLRTRLCELLGTDYPVISAPMGFLSGPELAAAVSNAGGLGIMSFNGNPPEALRSQIKRIRKLTDKPFGVNLILEGPRLPFPVDSCVDVCIEERVPVLSFFLGEASGYVPRAHAAGILVCDQVGTVEAAQRAARAGVDFLIAQGVEAGGHLSGEVGTLALVPRVVDAVAPTPIAAAGGIADARGLVAALALGAQAVSIGTRFIATPEAYAHPLYKEKILAAKETDTVRTTLFGNGWPNAPHRTLRTPFVEQWLANEGRGSEEHPDEPIIGETKIAGMTVPLHRFAALPPTPDATGDLDAMGFLAGQGVGLVREILPAGEIVRGLVAEAERIINGRLAPLTRRRAAWA